MMTLKRELALAAVAIAAAWGIPARAGVEVPYTQNLKSYSDFYTMEVVDANNDGNKGAHYADISFTTPDKSATGQTIEDLSNVELYRGETLIKEFGSQSVGTKLTYRDAEAPLGFNTYTVKVYNSAGEGMPASATTYVGEDTALSVKDIRLQDNDNALTLSWAAPGDKGVNIVRMTNGKTVKIIKR